MTETAIARVRTLEIPEGDVRWPLGGWLRREEWGVPLSDGRTRFGDAARYAGPKRLRVIATIDLTPHFGPLLHVSLSYADRDPSWVEIKAARAAFFPPDIDVMMMLPAEGFYVNAMEHCFHLTQTPTAWGLR